MLQQAAFGKGSLAVSSFFTYVGLGLGFLGSSLALPFGLLVIFLQRSPERYIQARLHCFVSAINLSHALACNVNALSLLSCYKSVSRGDMIWRGLSVWLCLALPLNQSRNPHMMPIKACTPIFSSSATFGEGYCAADSVWMLDDPQQ